MGRKDRFLRACLCSCCSTEEYKYASDIGTSICRRGRQGNLGCRLSGHIVISREGINFPRRRIQAFLQKQLVFLEPFDSQIPNQENKVGACSAHGSAVVCTIYFMLQHRRAGKVICLCKVCKEILIIMQGSIGEFCYQQIFIILVWCTSLNMCFVLRFRVERNGGRFYFPHVERFIQSEASID
jgi:hypothetical protein